MKYDFGGWATRNDLQCADGRVIKKDAFNGQNGQTVPLVWMHNHADPANVATRHPIIAAPGANHRGGRRS